ncbi:MAG: aldo/keto reductase [Deltaproteobacteria bacterium]|nr:aldo/keto reductase [Deltaproteobacteria bacterium]MBW2533107.1 aldo/keto reductase [Deltaproteobacteria bacterium]
MRYRYLGRSGLKVSELSFGSWVTFDHQLDVARAAECMTTAFDGGVNFFDNAEVYADGKSEELMGAALKKTGWRRDELVISTKIFWGGKGPNQRGLSRKHIVEGTDQALRRLQLDYVDLIFCHRPDPHTPIEETVRAMNHVVDQGKAFYWGTSEWSAAEIMEAYHVARRERLIPPLMEQPQYNMLVRERVEVEYAPLYERTGLGTTIWSPLASGLLTGKYNDGIPEGSRLSLERFDWLKKSLLGDGAEEKLAKVAELGGVATELGCTQAQLAIAWCLLNPNVSTVITGASRPEQVTENMRALDLLPKLDDGVVERIEGILDNRPAPPTDFRA